MSITVADCLRLPALCEAKVVAGHEGLNRIVTSASVLEYANYSALVDELFVGNELVISALTSVKDDTDAQCAAVRRLWETGEVGLVLYYVGIFVKQIDEKLIDLANELQFPLICMPTNRIGFRYSDALSEIFALLFKDNADKETIVSDVLATVSQLPERQRSVNALLRVLSDRLHCTFLLADRSLIPRGFAAWPMSAQWDMAGVLEEYKLCTPVPTAERPAVIHVGGTKARMCHLPVELEQRLDMHLLALGTADLPEAPRLLEAAEVIQLFISIWKCDFGNEGPDDLVRAILGDDPVTMRRIAEALHIDIASIHTMWVLHNNGAAPNGEAEKDANVRNAIVAKLFLQEHRKLALVDTFENAVVAFMDDSPYPELDAGLAEAFMATLPQTEEATLVTCPALETTTQVRRCYMLIEQALDAARKIYPARLILTLQELQFAQTCQSVLGRGEAAVEDALSPLAQLRQQDDAAELIETLSVFLLDAKESMQDTGERLFLHKNTVKYRINKIKQRLGYDVSKLPEAYALYAATALLRLLC